MTQQKLAEENINRLAHYDTLTNLTTAARSSSGCTMRWRLRGGMATCSRCSSSTSTASRMSTSAFGHLTGDEVLKIMAQRISDTIRASDTAARLGGDEFIVLAENVAREGDVSEFAQRLLDDCPKPFNMLGQECRLSASVGIATCPHDGDDAATWSRRPISRCTARRIQATTASRSSPRSTAAPGRADRDGRGHPSRVDTNPTGGVLYQPKVSVRTGTMTGVEALVRWEHPERGLLLPDLFIPLAEDSGLIRHIGRWVLHRAAQALAWAIRRHRPDTRRRQPVAAPVQRRAPRDRRDRACARADGSPICSNSRSPRA